MTKMLIIDMDKCNGCKACELVCCLYQEKRVQPSKSRIHVLRWPERGAEVPMMCQQCEIAMCQKACPVDAIRRDEYGAMLVDPNKCIGCKLCVFACPFGGSIWDFDGRKIMKCDLCKGTPQCARFCPTEAIQYVEPTRAMIWKKRASAAKMAELAKLIYGT